MTDEPSFHDLILRVRCGDEAAATELVRRYEPEIRRVARLRLTDPRLGRVLDSMDVCQSVLANFFVRAAAGQFELDEPGQLLKLLVTMARNKLHDHARRQSAARRDRQRLQAGASALDQLPATEPSPSRVVAGRELLEEVRRRLSAEERRLSELRGEGHDWAEIAALVGGSPAALRMRLARALDRVAQELGYEEVAHG